MNLELRHLKVVCAIAETGSVTKAAASLGLAQPALTAQLQRIERVLGGPLFQRDRTGTTPTALGELVLARAKVVLPAMKGLQDEAVRLAGGETAPSRYRIGAVNGPILGGLISRAAQDQPQAQLVPYPSWSLAELTDMVQVGKLDFCVAGVCGDMMPGTPSDGLTWRVIATDAVFVLMPETHPLARRFEIPLSELADAHWVSTPGDGCFGDCFAAACARAGFTPRTMYEMDVGGCIDFVQSGHAVGLCQATFRQVKGLVAVPLAGAPLRWRHLLGWHPDSPAADFAPAALMHAAGAYADSLERNPRYAQWLTLNPSFGAATPGRG
jgi:DNA-binding transcriptional LysR family regulator